MKHYTTIAILVPHPDDVENHLDFHKAVERDITSGLAAADKSNISMFSEEDEGWALKVQVATEFKSAGYRLGYSVEDPVG
jgi:hypothetical protein